ncbi:MAG: thiamine pyrophosphate-dependent enzyme, partial [Oscillospiraceae bacterium]|nr:thiamine pyrophosphate-dependent enzyme [Oscillospiraceae bacterium]
MKNNLLNFDFPAELETIKPKELSLLASLIRDFLLDNISKTGGHLASNLGIVELSIAIHKVFNSPEDKIIWDVGHQCYVHKILTGRANEFNHLRQYGGISGFPKRSESPHDVFNSGHSSNSISAAMGFAEARDLTGGANSVIAVIGDGALTGGQAFEGLNNAGNRSTKIIVILNDNEMSISKNIGGISHHLSHLRTSVKYVELKTQIKKTLKNIPGIGPGIYSGIEGIRDLIKFLTLQSGALFESLGFKYFGPVDGHNISDLMEVLTVSKLIEQPVFIHVITKKGKGYRNAEKNPDRFHGIGPFDPSLGKQHVDESELSSAECFGKKMVVMAEMDKRVTAITAAMADGTGLKPFAAAWP